MFGISQVNNSYFYDLNEKSVSQELNDKDRELLASPLKRKIDFQLFYQSPEDYQNFEKQTIETSQKLFNFLINHQKSIHSFQIDTVNLQKESFLLSNSFSILKNIEQLSLRLDSPQLKIADQKKISDSFANFSNLQKLTLTLELGSLKE